MTTLTLFQSIGSGSVVPAKGGTQPSPFPDSRLGENDNCDDGVSVVHLFPRRHTGAHNLILIILLSLLTICPVAVAQQLEQIIQVDDGRYTFVKPSQAEVSPTGSSFVIVDPLANRLCVFHSTGELSWVVGEGTALNLPSAACFSGEDALLFALQGQRVILRAEAANPLLIDTVATLDNAPGTLRSIDCLKKAPGNTFLVLDRGSAQIYRFDDRWKPLGVMVPHGQGRGKVWSPINFAVDLAGNIIVTDGANIPVQVFSPSGKVLFQAGWNKPAAERRWQAGGVAISNEEIIWVADNTNAVWRLYDPSGNELEKRPFDQPGLRPVSMSFTFENKLIVVDEHGSASLYSPFVK